MAKLQLASGGQATDTKIVNGQTVDSSGNRAKLSEGDRVTDDYGRTWVYSEAAGKGILDSEYKAPTTPSRSGGSSGSSGSSGGGYSTSSVTQPSYDANTDYMALIIAENNKGANADQNKIAQWEAQRNAKIADMNKNNANPNGYSSADTTKYIGTPVSITLSNGNQTTGYVRDGVTYDANGNRYQFNEGDRVLADNGKTYVYSAKEGRGIEESLYQAPQSTRTVKTINGGKPITITYAPDGETITAITLPNGQSPAAMDAVILDDGDYLYWYEDENGNGDWTIGSKREYDMYVQWYDSLANYQRQYDELNDMFLDAVQTKNRAATEEAVAEIRANIDKQMQDLDAQMQEAYRLQQVEERNQAQRSYMAGDRGGIGQKQYGSVQSNYDQTMAQIALTRQSIINEGELVEQQLRYQGMQAEADAIKEYVEFTINRLDNMYQFDTEMEYKYDTLAEQQRQYDIEVALNRAYNLIDQGILTADAVEALGLTEAEAADLAEYLNTTRDLDLQAKKLTLQQAAYKARGTGGGGNTTTDTDYGMADQELLAYQQLLGTTGVPVYDGNNNEVGTFFAPQNSEPFMIDANGNTVYDPFSKSSVYHINLIGRNLYWDDEAGKWQSNVWKTDQSADKWSNMNPAEADRNYNAQLLEYESQLNDIQAQLDELNNKWHFKGNELRWEDWRSSKGVEYERDLNKYLKLDSEKAQIALLKDQWENSRRYNY